VVADARNGRLHDLAVASVENHQPRRVARRARLLRHAFLRQAVVELFEPHDA